MSNVAPQLLLTAEKYLSYLRGVGVPASALDVAEIGVFAWGPLWERIVRDTGAVRQSDWILDRDWRHHRATKSGLCISIFRMPTGAPAATFLLEIAIAAGLKTILVVGTAGSLDPKHCAGSVVVVQSALAGDGTSSHYTEQRLPPTLEPAPMVHSSRMLLARLCGAFKQAGVGATCGVAWTTDAPFRGTQATLAHWRAQGACVSEMEAAALYAAALVRHVEICDVVVVSDELWDGWHGGMHRREFHTGIDSVCRVVARLAFDLAEVGRRFARR